MAFNLLGSSRNISRKCFFERHDYTLKSIFRPFGEFKIVSISIMADIFGYGFCDSLFVEIPFIQGAVQKLFFVIF